MATTYQAEIHGNKIRWIDPIPDNLSNKDTHKVIIKFWERNKETSNKNDMVEFFQNSPLFGIDLEVERKKD